MARTSELSSQIRGQQIVLDKDLAKLYGVKNKDLKHSVRRNTERFPLGFLFELTKEEFANLRRQIGASSSVEDSESWGGERYLPFAFTELGVAMLSSVLRSEPAIQVP
jgi:hypothetical protein